MPTSQLGFFRADGLGMFVNAKQQWYAGVRMAVMVQKKGLIGIAEDCSKNKSTDLILQPHHLVTKNLKDLIPAITQMIFF